MPEILTAFIPYAALIAVYMTAWFVVALIRKDNSIADIAWGLGFVLIAAVSLLRRGDRAGRPVLATTLIFIWGLRLAIHIVLRNRKRGEDSRYAEWRRNWGRSFIWRSYLQVFLLQGLFLLLISSAVILINRSIDAVLPPLGLLDAAGTAVWTVASGSTRAIRTTSASL